MTESRGPSTDSAHFRSGSCDGLKLRSAAAFGLPRSARPSLGVSGQSVNATLGVFTTWK